MTSDKYASMNLGDFIKSEREKKGLLMRELAALVDVDTSMISKVENSYRIPTKEQVEKMAKALELDTWSLLNIWYAEKIYQEIKDEKNAIEILNIVEQMVKKELI